MKTKLALIRAGQSLTRAQAKEAVLALISGEFSDTEAGEFLLALRDKKETAEELLGFVDGLSSGLVPFSHDGEILLDVCGTGGDRAGTFNVSTAVAIILASMGVAIAKHGNRGVSSRSGSSDVLEILGLKSDLTSAGGIQSLQKHGLSFLFAPAFYPVLAKLAAVRKSLGVYTIFNALGPLLNPARLTHQMVGVYDLALLPKMAAVLKEKGLEEVYVVHGEDGLDEISISSPTSVLHLQNGKTHAFTLTPEDFGVQRVSLDQVKGGSPTENAEILLDIFRGKRSPKRDLVLINAAAALVLIGQEKNYQNALALAAASLDSGMTLKFFETLKSGNS